MEYGLFELAAQARAVDVLAIAAGLAVLGWTKRWVRKVQQAEQTRESEAFRLRTDSSALRAGK